MITNLRFLVCSKLLQRTRKVLILGCGEAGKSTFIKQLKIIEKMEKEDVEKEDMIFSEEEKATCRRNMAANIVSAILTLTGITVKKLILILMIPNLDQIDSICCGFLLRLRNIQYWKNCKCNVHKCNTTLIRSSHI